MNRSTEFFKNHFPHVLFKHVRTGIRARVTNCDKERARILQLFKGNQQWRGNIFNNKNLRILSIPAALRLPKSAASKPISETNAKKYHQRMLIEKMLTTGYAITIRVVGSLDQATFIRKG